MTSYGNVQLYKCQIHSPKLFFKFANLSHSFCVLVHRLCVPSLVIIREKL